MKYIKKTIILIASLFTLFTIFFWYQEISKPIPLTGCVNTSKDYGWPLKFYTPAGELVCGDLPGVDTYEAYFSFGNLATDIIVIVTIIYWLYKIFTKIGIKSVFSAILTWFSARLAKPEKPIVNVEKRNKFLKFSVVLLFVLGILITTVFFIASIYLEKKEEKKKACPKYVNCMPTIGEKNSCEIPKGCEGITGKIY